MCDLFQSMHEQYHSEVAGPWQTRDCSAWEYDTKAQELIQMADNLPPYHTTEEAWLRPQAKILQNRANYIRQQQARKEAEKQAKQQAEQARKEADELFKQQLATLQASIQANLQQLATQATQYSTPPTPPAPQEAQKEEEKEKEQPLYQATVEDIMESITESTTKHGNSMVVSKSTLSTFPRLCTTRCSGDSAACVSNALLLACQHTMFLAWHGLLPGYIEYSEGMEATGQG